MAIDFHAFDLTRPRDRYRLLKGIPPDRAIVRTIHKELLDLFRIEMDYRKEDCPPQPDQEFDYVELIYWCGLLLYLIGDPADAPLMWEAKHIDFDIGCSFDIQFLVGAGVDETVQYLEAQGQAQAVAYIKECQLSRDFEDLPGWERFRIHYFYPNITFPEKG